MKNISAYVIFIAITIFSTNHSMFNLAMAARSFAACATKGTLEINKRSLQSYPSRDKTFNKVLLQSFRSYSSDSTKEKSRTLNTLQDQLTYTKKKKERFWITYGTLAAGGGAVEAVTNETEFISFLMTNGASCPLAAAIGLVVVPVFYGVCGMVKSAFCCAPLGLIWIGLDIERFDLEDKEKTLMQEIEKIKFNENKVTLTDPSEIASFNRLSDSKYKITGYVTTNGEITEFFITLREHNVTQCSQAPLLQQEIQSKGLLPIQNEELHAEAKENSDTSSNRDSPHLSTAIAVGLGSYAGGGSTNTALQTSAPFLAASFADNEPGSDIAAAMALGAYAGSWDDKK